MYTGVCIYCDAVFTSKKKKSHCAGCIKKAGCTSANRASPFMETNHPFCRYCEAPIPREKPSSVFCVGGKCQKAWKKEVRKKCLAFMKKHIPKVHIPGKCPRCGGKVAPSTTGRRDFCCSKHSSEFYAWRMRLVQGELYPKICLYCGGVFDGNSWAFCCQEHSKLHNINRRNAAKRKLHAKRKCIVCEGPLPKNHLVLCGNTACLLADRNRRGAISYALKKRTVEKKEMFSDLTAMETVIGVTT